MKNALAWGTWFGFFSVMFGAFGAHALKKIVEPHYLSVFEVGIKYQMFHALALILVGLIAHQRQLDLRWPTRFFIFGIFIFSGSLYLLALSGVEKLGMVTPVGGVFFLLGWLALARRVC